MKKLLNLLGLHIDQQSLANIVSKIFGIAGLIGGGLLNPASVLHDGFGLVISEAANGRIKWWSVAIGVVVTYFTAQNTDRTAGQNTGAARSASLPMVGLLFIASAGAMLSGCGSTPVRRATLVETAAVQAVHATVQAEAAAFAAHAYDGPTHQRYLVALHQVVQAEKTLNDALLVWAHTQGQPMPAAVAEAVRATAGILNDLQPLIPKNSAAATLAASLVKTISLLTGASTS